MPLADYAHWNEDAQYMWWHEEGKHVEEPPDVSDDDPRWDYEEVECRRESDCLDASCFSLPSATHIWECDVCGRQFPNGHPEETS